MNKMKNSGIAWIGEVPYGWNIDKIKYISKLKGRIGWQGLTSDEYIDEGPYLITGVDFKNGSVDWESCVHISEKRWHEAKEIQIQNGDLLITKDGTVGKVAIVSGLVGKASLNSGVLLVRTNDTCLKPFLYWVLLSDEFWEWFKLKNAGNSTIIHLYQNVFAEFSFIMPSPTEQQAISDFLDEKCEKIDSIVSDLEKEIEILEKYKKSLITETVTKGLDKNVPMKDSGVDIVGNVPQKWCVKRLKYLTKITTGTQDTQDAIDEGKYQFYVRSPIIERSNKYDYDGEAILMAGDGVGAGKVFHYAIGKFGCHQRVYIICEFKNIFAKYLFYYLKELFTLQMEKGSAKSTVDSIRLPMLNNFYICLPDIKEQQQIVDFLENKCVEINSTISAKEKQLETIKKYKQSLIYEYVTGKKRVAGFGGETNGN